METDVFFHINKCVYWHRPITERAKNILNGNIFGEADCQYDYVLESKVKSYSDALKLVRRMRGYGLRVKIQDRTKPRVGNLDELFDSSNDEDGMALIDYSDGCTVLKCLKLINGCDGFTLTGLFDHHSREWDNCSDLRVKLRVIEELKEFLWCTFDYLIYLYMKDCQKKGDRHQFVCISNTIKLYSPYSTEADNSCFKDFDIISNWKKPAIKFIQKLNNVKFKFKKSKSKSKNF